MTMRTLHETIFLKTTINIVNQLSFLPAITALVDATAGMILFTTPKAQTQITDHVPVIYQFQHLPSRAHLE